MGIRGCELKVLLRRAKIAVLSAMNSQEKMGFGAVRREGNQRPRQS
jgi:hypothetical protein